MSSFESFVSGYLEALFFTECEPGTTRATHDPENQSSLPGDVDADDIGEQQMLLIRRDCRAFVARARSPLETATRQPGYSWERAGHDFWLTRNRHGAGFWDRDELPQRTRAALTSWAHAMAEVSAYLGDDGKVYLQ